MDVQERCGSCVQAQLQRGRGVQPSIAPVRRTPFGGLGAALLLALALAPTASASPLTTPRPAGTPCARDDRTLPPAQALSAPVRAAGGLRGAPSDRRSARAAAARRTVSGELARMLAAGAIDQATHDASRAIYRDAQ